MLPDRRAAPAVPERVAAVLASVLPGPCALHEPEFGGREAEYVADCIAAGWVSTAGAYVNRFEEDLCAFTGAAHAVATNNGTAALHLCLRVLGLGAGDEVIVPALSFVATANAVAYTGAACHFADISPATFGLDPAKLEAGLRAAARMEGGVCVNRASGRPLRASSDFLFLLGSPVHIDWCLELAWRRICILISKLYKLRSYALSSAKAASSFPNNRRSKLPYPWDGTPKGQNFLKTKKE